MPRTSTAPLPALRRRSITGGALAHPSRPADDALGRPHSRATPRRSAASRPSRTGSCSPRCARRRGSCRTGSTTSAASPTRSRAASSRSIGRASSTTRCASRWASSASSRRGTRRSSSRSWRWRRRSPPGNTVVIKPSEITSASALELARARRGGRHPARRHQRRHRLPRETGEALVDHPTVAKIAFTGSVGAGRAIAARAGARLRRCTLELGGKSPNIVFDDADLEQAEAGVLAGIFAAAGQTCVAGSRAFMRASIYDDASSTASPGAPGRSASAIRWKPRRRWGRWRRRCSSRRTSRW